jgi:hypothetical protein
MTAASKIFGAMKPATLPKRNCAALKRKGRPDRQVVNRKLIFTYVWWPMHCREFMERSTHETGSILRKKLSSSFRRGKVCISCKNPYGVDNIGLK